MEPTVMLKFGHSSITHSDLDKLKSKPSVMSPRIPIPTQGLELVIHSSESQCNVKALRYTHI